jgi:hypothetical protein
VVSRNAAIGSGSCIGRPSIGDGLLALVSELVAEQARDRRQQFIRLRGSKNLLDCDRNYGGTITCADADVTKGACGCMRSWPSRKSLKNGSKAAPRGNQEFHAKPRLRKLGLSGLTAPVPIMYQHSCFLYCRCANTGKSERLGVRARPLVFQVTCFTSRAAILCSCQATIASSFDAIAMTGTAHFGAPSP